MPVDSIFVYGTLMTGMSNHNLIQPFIKNICAGEADGVLYDLPFGYPAMTTGRGKVKGELFWLRNIEEALPVLDNLEGYYGPEHANNLYNRVTQRIKTADGDMVLSYVYLWANPGELSHLGTLVGEGDWRKLKEGGVK